MDRIQALFRRVGEYSPIAVFIELAVIWLLVYAVVRFVQGTRAAGALRGILILLLVLVLAALSLRALGVGADFGRLTFLSERLFAVVAIALVVVFQPELRRALIRLGEAPFFRSTPGEIARTVDATVEACTYLAKNRFGALIVLERQVGLQTLTEGGTKLGAEVSAALLKTIFFPGSALHDLAVVIRGTVVDAAGVQLPLAEPEEMPDPALGSRHRAAAGVTREGDALAVIVSEETGLIRIAERGKLSKGLTAEELRRELRDRLSITPPMQAATAWNDPKNGEVRAEKPGEARGGGRGEGSGGGSGGGSGVGSGGRAGDRQAG